MVTRPKLNILLKNALAFILLFAFAFPVPGLNPIYDVPEAEAGLFKVIFLTTADTTWTVPNDWPAVGNTVEVIGGGGGAGDGSNEGTGGAGGGAYARSINLKLIRGTVMTAGTEFSVGAAGAGGETNNGPGTNGGNTWFNASSLANCVTVTNTICAGAEGGKLSAGNAITVGDGGLAANSVGVLTFDGGSGGAGDSGTADAGGGGGGAGGRNGAGNVGIAGTSTGNGGSGDAGFGGAGGLGGGANPGGNGAEWRSSLGVIAGSGGGGGGGTNGGAGGVGGSYGGGGGGGEVQASPFADGGPGLIVITYVPTGHVIRGGVKIRGSVKFR